MGLKILGRVDTLYFSGKNINLCILPFKMHKIIYIPEKMKKIQGFTSKFR